MTIFTKNVLAKMVLAALAMESVFAAETVKHSDLYTNGGQYEPKRLASLRGNDDPDGRNLL